MIHVLGRIATLDEGERRALFAQLLIISGLRQLEPIIKEEAQKTPILNSVLDHQVIGPAFRQGQQKGRQEIVRRQLEKRFGPLPAPLEARLMSLSASALDDIAVRLLEAKRLEELFPAQP